MLFAWHSLEAKAGRAKTCPGKRPLNRDWFCIFSLAMQLRETGVKDLAHSREREANKGEKKRYTVK